MTDGKRQEDASLLDVLVDGFEKNEMLGGFHHRELPMPSEAAAALRFEALADEARRWQGAPLRSEAGPSRRLVAWQDLEIRQAGRGIMVRVKAPMFDRWWNEPGTWKENPMGQIFDWIEEEVRGNSSSG